MKLKKYFSKYLFTIIAKLLGLSIVIAIVHIIVIFSLGKYLGTEIGIEIFIAIMPLAFFLIYLIGNFIFFYLKERKNKFFDILSHCKYYLLFPFWFHYDRNPVKNKKINLDLVKARIKEGDILLRRYHRHLDGFIFSENSYFTHAGIYVGEYDQNAYQVFHCTAQKGVHPICLKDFCNCDDIAILRFSFDKSPDEEEMYGNITNKVLNKGGDEKITEQEKAFFNKLMRDVKPEPPYNLKNNVYDVMEYNSVILDEAKSLKDTPYDLQFNFKNFDKLSCIEYVWYCFKCVFPLHRIRVKDFEFFEFIKLPVIIPDVFVRNDFFTYVYSSMPGVEPPEKGVNLNEPNAYYKKKLMDYVKKKRWPFWKFVLMVFVWDIIFLGANYLYCLFIS